MADLDVAEIPYESGPMKFRYSRYLAEGGNRWIRHGLFVQYYENGQVASEGHYEHGKESGLWRQFHENGQLAAEGHYENGKEIGQWKYWDPSGKLEQ